MSSVTPQSLPMIAVPDMKPMCNETAFTRSFNFNPEVISV